MHDADPAMDHPPLPKLRPGQLIGDDVEIRSLIGSDMVKNLYQATHDLDNLWVLEYRAGLPEPETITQPLSVLFPAFEDAFFWEGRNFFPAPEPRESRFVDRAFPCWEPGVIQATHDLVEACSKLTDAGIALSDMTVHDLILSDSGWIFWAVPRKADRKEQGGEDFIRAFLVELLFRRLIPKVTRSLEHPLRCLGFSRETEARLQDFMDSRTDLTSLRNWLSKADRVVSADWDVAGMTDEGRVRDHNEDAFGWAKSMLQTCRRNRHGLLIAVADGMGGHLRGELASHYALVNWMSGMTSRLIRVERPENPVLRDLVGTAFDEAETAVLSEEDLRCDDPYAYQIQPGSTLVAGLILDRLLFLGNCGDSRAYLLADQKLRRITKDHSLVQTYLDNGDLTEEEARHHDHRNVITSFIGIDWASYRKSLFIHEAGPGTRILLCSDGLTDMLTDKEVARILREASRAEDACRQLIQAANRAGGEDNITVLVAIDRTAEPGTGKEEEPGGKP